MYVYRRVDVKSSLQDRYDDLRHIQEILDRFPTTQVSRLDTPYHPLIQETDMPILSTRQETNDTRVALMREIRELRTTDELVHKKTFHTQEELGRSLQLLV